MSGRWGATLILIVGSLCCSVAGANPLPLEGRTSELRFSTTSGSWMSIDVAPDGQGLVFDLLGDLYTLPIDGGRAVPLTTGLAYDSQPQFSPDGEWIAYISDADGAPNLWIARRDGSDARALSSETQWPMISPAWSPDGQFIVVTRAGLKPELLLYHRDGGDGARLMGEDEDEAPWGMGAVFGDNAYLYFAAPRASTRPVANFPSAQIVRFDRRTGTVAQLTQGIGGGVRPRLSPDGRSLVYGTRHDTHTGLRIRDLASGADRWLVYPVQRDSQEGFLPPSRDLLPGYAFTPDGQHLIYAAEGSLWRVDVATGARAAIPFSADVRLDIGPDLSAPYRLDDDDFSATLIQDPRLSPDADRVVASVLTKLYVMKVDGSSPPERLTREAAHEFKPRWSPDGRWIAYVTWSDREGGHIWRTRADGRGRPERLSEAPAFYTGLAYSPDGEHLYAQRGLAFQRQQTFSEFDGLRLPLELVRLPAAGGTAVLVGEAGDPGSVHFGPEGDRIYRYGDESLFSTDLAGRDRRVALRVSAPRGNRRGDKPPAAESVLLGRDGRHALVFAQKQLWLAPFVAVGAQPLELDLCNAAVPVRALTDVGADHFGWSADGREIWWAIGRHFYRRSLDSILDTGGEAIARPARCGDDPDGEEVAGADREVTQSPLRTHATPLDAHPAVAALDFAVPQKRAVPGGSLLLEHASLIAMRPGPTAGMDRVENNRDVLVTDGRIAALGPTGSLEVPPGTRRIDLEGRYLLPGFIDTHAHFEFRTDDVLEPHNWSLAANLAYGVTTGLDVQTATEDYFAYRDMVETGQTIGQRALMTGPGIFGDSDFRSYAAVQAYLRRYSEHYATHNIKAYLSGNRRQRQWIVLASQELGLLPTTEGGGDQRLDITHAIDGMHGNEHTLPESPLGEDLVQLYARTRTAYTPTLIVQYNAEPMREYFFTRHDIHDDPKLRRFTPANRLDELTERRPGWQRDDEFRFREGAADAARIQRAGGLVGVGGHAELQGLGYHWEMWAYAMGGMRPVEVLRAATIDGASIVGVAGDLGSVEVGKLADLIVLDANPLEDIRNTATLSRVIQRGRVYDADTLDEEWPQRRAFPPFWWWEDALPQQP